MITYELFKEAVLVDIDDDFNDDNLEFLYNLKQDDTTDEVETIIRFSYVSMVTNNRPVTPRFVAKSIKDYRNDQLEREYDGPDDGEAWSGGFADNH